MVRKTMGGMGIDVDTSRVSGDVEFLSLMHKACKRNPSSRWHKPEDGLDPKAFADVLVDLVQAQAHDPLVRQWQQMTTQFLGERSMMFSNKDWNVVPEAGTLTDQSSD